MEQYLKRVANHFSKVIKEIIQIFEVNYESKIE